MGRQLPIAPPFGLAPKGYIGCENLYSETSPEPSQRKLTPNYSVPPSKMTRWTKVLYFFRFFGGASNRFSTCNFLGPPPWEQNLKKTITPVASPPSVRPSVPVVTKTCKNVVFWQRRAPTCQQTHQFLNVLLPTRWYPNFGTK